VILFTGDGDFGPEALDKNWAIEIWFWSYSKGLMFYNRVIRACTNIPLGFSTRLTEMYISHPDYKAAFDSRTTIMNLDDYYRKFMFACGYNDYIGIKYLEIFTDLVKDSDIMKCYVELDLFGWWYRQNSNTLKLYHSQWEAIKNLMMRIYPNAREITKGGGKYCSLRIFSLSHYYYG
jgi:hypothetical protein